MLHSTAVVAGERLDEIVMARRSVEREEGISKWSSISEEADSGRRR
jgi:hypothetical protein